MQNDEVTLHLLDLFKHPGSSRISGALTESIGLGQSLQDLDLIYNLLCPTAATNSYASWGSTTEEATKNVPRTGRYIYKES